MTDHQEAPQGTRALMMQIGARLSDQGANYDVNKDGSMLALIGEAGCGRCNGVIAAEIVETDAPMLLVQVSYSLPFDPIDEDRWLAVYELIALLAPHMTLGHFEYDHEVEELRWRAHQLLPPTGPWDNTLLMALPLEGIDVIDSAFEAFDKVISRGDDANLAVAEMLLAQVDGDPVELFGEEILRMVQTARRRVEGGDAALIDRVSALLVRLTD